MANETLDARILSRLEEIRTFAETGLDDGEIAKRLSLSAALFRRYRAKNAHFSAMLDRIRANSSQEVEDALFKRALGYNARVLKQFKVKRVEYDPDTGKKRVEYEEMVPAEEESHVSADLQAQMIWLTNRKPERWSQKPQSGDGDKRTEGGVVLMPMAADSERMDALPEGAEVCEDDETEDK